MIAYLEGKVLQIEKERAIIQTGWGLGYELFLTNNLLSGLAPGQEVKIFVYTVVREDLLALYGFSSWEEREIFAVLLTIPKIGPKIGLAILNFFNPEKLEQIVAQEDVSLLAQVPGIGPKTAKKILLDLKDKIKLTSAWKPSQENSVFADALEGLKGLGYNEKEVASLLKEILTQEPELDVASLIREVLKQKAKL